MTDRRTRALEIARNMLSPDTAASVDGTGRRTGFCDDMDEMGLVHVLETLWTREGIDLRTRSIVTVSMLIALKATNELRIHVPAAVRNGVTIPEIEELIMHSACYVGFPAAATARETARAALEEAGML